MRNYKYFAILALFITCLNNPLFAEDVSFIKKIKYEASLGYTQLRGNAWWSKIEPYNLYLGALPLKNKGHLDDIMDLGVTHILSMVEDFELEDGWINQPVKKTEWENAGAVVYQIPTVDFLPLSEIEITNGIEYLRQSLEDGHTVYIHCKAGVGRSASIVIAFLMHTQGMSLDEAIALVKEHRPQINLNAGQRRAIQNYFQENEEETPPSKDYLEKAQEVTQEAFEEALSGMLKYVVDGIEFDSGEYMPQCLAWMPEVKIESTLSRRDRYLREFAGDQDAAVKAAVTRNNKITRKLKLMAVKFTPFIGFPTSYSMSLWHQLREIALIASIYGHDVKDPEVQMRILESLVTAKAMGVPAKTVDNAAKWVIKAILVEAGYNYIPVYIPAKMIFNYFTNNAAKVSAQAISHFGGENAKPVPESDYQLDFEVDNM